MAPEPETASMEPEAKPSAEAPEKARGKASPAVVVKTLLDPQNGGVDPI